MPTFLISETFTDSLARLSGDEQKAVKTTAFDLQLNPVGAGLSFHKLDKARDKDPEGEKLPEVQAARRAIAAGAR